MYDRIDAALNSAKVIAVAKIRNDLVVNDRRHRIVLVIAIARPHFNPQHAIQTRDQQHHAIVPRRIPDTPGIEEPRRERFDRALMTVVRHIVDHHDRELDVGFPAELFQFFSQDLFLFDGQQIGEVVDIGLGVFRIGLRRRTYGQKRKTERSETSKHAKPPLHETVNAAIFP